MIVRLITNSKRHGKAGDKLNCDSVLGSHLICAGLAEVVSFESPEKPAAIVNISHDTEATDGDSDSDGLIEPGESDHDGSDD